MDARATQSLGNQHTSLAGHTQVIKEVPGPVREVIKEVIKEVEVIREVSAAAHSNAAHGLECYFWERRLTGVVRM